MAKLYAMGLLSDRPERRKVFQKFVSNDSRKRYSGFDQKEIVGLYFTPDLPRSWIAYQFERLGYDPEKMMRRLRFTALRHKHKWKHVGPDNVMFIGEAEVERFYARKNPASNNTFPPWAIAVFRAQRKRGVTLKAIADKHGFHYKYLGRKMSKSIFERPKRGYGMNNPWQNQWKRKKG